MIGNKKRFSDESDDTDQDQTVGQAGGMSDYTHYEEDIDETSDEDFGIADDYPAEPLGNNDNRDLDDIR